MYYFLLILFIINSAITLDTAQNSKVNDNIKVHPSEDVNKTRQLNKTEKFDVNDSSSTPMPSPKSDLSSSPMKNITEESLSNNTSQINLKIKSPDTSEKESAQTHNPTITPEKVFTEGGNSVFTLGNSVTNFQNSRETSGKTILTEGGDQGIISDKVESVIPKLNTTHTSSKNENSNKSQSIEGISSMNKGKITPRKGVDDPKQMNATPRDDNQVGKTGVVTHSPLTILKDKEPLPTVSSNITHVRMAKPLVTDDKSESSVSRIKKIDYIVPIVCTAFTVPLLIVLGVYLYKKGSDLWERRHYNRMDFLIEGIYNE